MDLVIHTSRMRPILCALPFALLLPACGEDPGGTEGSGGTGSADSTTGEATGSTTEPGTTTLDETSTTTEAPATATATTTGEAPVTGAPSIHREACGPDDGLSVEIKINLAARACDSTWPEDVPVFSILLYKGPGDLTPGEHALAGGMGMASYDDGFSMVFSENGTVVITEVTGDGVRGSFEVTLPDDDTVITGDFDSLYCPVDVLCG